MRVLATLRTNWAVIILKQLLHVFVKLLQLVGFEWTREWTRRLARATFARAVPHVNSLVPLLLGFIKINCLLKFITSLMPRLDLACCWPRLVTVD